MPDSLDGLERIAVDAFTRLTQWDAAFRHDVAVLTHEAWQVDWVWHRYGAALSDVALVVDELEVARARGRAAVINGAAATRMIEQLKRGSEGVSAELAHRLTLAAGWPPLYSAHRTRSTALHDTISRAALVASGLPAAETAGNVRAHVVPVLDADADGRALGWLAAASRGGGLLEETTVWQVGGAAGGRWWRVARQQDSGPLMTAGWAALTAEMAGASQTESDAAASTSLRAHFGEVV